MSIYKDVYEAMFANNVDKLPKDEESADKIPQCIMHSTELIMLSIHTGKVSISYRKPIIYIKRL